MDTEETYLNIVKAIYNQPTANITLNGEKLKPFSLKIRNKTRMSTLTTITQHSFGSPHYRNWKRKKIQIGKEVKLSLLADDMVLYIENPKNATRKLLKLISEFDKVLGPPWYLR